MGSDSADPVLVFLDQHHWVALRRAEVSGVGSLELEVLERLRQGVRDGSLVVPLTCAHYLETWHRPKWPSRSGLAGLMREISGWATLAPIQDVSQLEIERALSGRERLVSRDVLGHGVNHAFGSPTGRFRLVERAWTSDHPEEGPAIPVVADQFRIVQELHPDAWEWMNLAGLGVDFPIPEFDDSQFEIRPEHRRGDAFVAQDRELVARLAADGLSRRLRDLFVMTDLEELVDALNSACLRLRYNPDQLRVEGKGPRCNYMSGIPPKL